ncbi:hypothetical protein R6867_12965, partial [Mycobacterium tuberculosis]
FFIFFFFFFFVRAATNFYILAFVCSGSCVYGTYRTLPLEIYLQRVTDPDAAVALSLLLVVVAALVVLGVGARTPIGTDTR